MTMALNSLQQPRGRAQLSKALPSIWTRIFLVFLGSLARSDRQGADISLEKTRKRRGRVGTFLLVGY